MKKYIRVRDGIYCLSTFEKMVEGKADHDSYVKFTFDKNVVYVSLKNMNFEEFINIFTDFLRDETWIIFHTLKIIEEKKTEEDFSYFAPNKD